MPLLRWLAFVFPRLIAGFHQFYQKERLVAVGPRSVLARGFSCTVDQTGQVVRSVEGVEPGSTLTTLFEDGRIQSRVEVVESDPPLDDLPDEG